jgi:hypothetical protein
MLGWFQALMPREERFFTLFAKHAAMSLRGLKRYAACCTVGTPSKRIASRFSSARPKPTM